MASKYQILLDVWNAQKELGKWKAHRKITPDIKKAVDENMQEGWDIEDMSGAIVNFAACVHSKETTWTYSRWGLAQFFTRGKQEDNKRWIWFIENNYREDEWLTRTAIGDRLRQRKQAEKPAKPIRKPYAEMTEEELTESFNEGNQFVRMTITKIRAGKKIG